MKKLGRRLLILLIIGGVLYGGYYFFVRPTGYTSKSELARTFFTEIHQNDACSSYFQEETQAFCDGFVELFEGETLTIGAVTETAQTAKVTVTVNGNSDTFEVFFVRETVTGIRGFLTNYYYKIDTIQ